VGIAVGRPGTTRVIAGGRVLDRRPSGIRAARSIRRCSLTRAFVVHPQRTADASAEHRTSTDEASTARPTSTCGTPTAIEWSQDFSDVEWASEAAPMTHRRRQPRREEQRHASCSSCAAERSDSGSGRPGFTWSVAQATFAADDCPLLEVRAFAGTHNGHERLGCSPEALHEVVEPILAAVRDGGCPPCAVSSPRSTPARTTAKSRRA